MNIKNIAIAAGLIIAALVMALLTEGLFLPLSLPMLIFALQYLGVVSK